MCVYIPNWFLLKTTDFFYSWRHNLIHLMSHYSIFWGRTHTNHCIQYQSLYCLKIHCLLQTVGQITNSISNYTKNSMVSEHEQCIWTQNIYTKTSELRFKLCCHCWTRLNRKWFWSKEYFILYLFILYYFIFYFIWIL